MSIFQDAHTYLIISFLLMLVVLGKTVIKKMAGVLTTDIKKLESDFSSLEQRKIEAEKTIERLTKDLEEAGISIDKAVMAAKNEAALITKKASDEIDEVVQKKQKEYDVAIAKIRSSLSLELHNKIVDMTVKRLSGKLLEAADDRALHSHSIATSSDMIEELSSKRN
jgi:F0F1-type ATP synthase membrane subunit b/b'